MKTRTTVAWSMLAGVAAGAAAVQALHAQAKPPAYVIAEIDVTNVEPYDRDYVPPAAKAIRDGGGKYWQHHIPQMRACKEAPTYNCFNTSTT